MNNIFIFKKVKINSFVILIFTFLFSTAFSNDFDKCLWIKSETMQDRKMVEDALALAKGFKFDKVFIQVRSRGDAFYNSDIVIKNHLIEDGFDPLGYAVKLGHELNLEIHAWVNVYMLWSNFENMPDNPNHLLHSQPDWIEANIYGKLDSDIYKVFNDKNKKKKQPSKNWEGIFLSPNNPEVNNYLVSVFSELINNYDIDGLHFDYIRFQDDIYGYNKIGRDIFENEHGFDPYDIDRNVISPKYGWETAEIDSMKKIWKEYKIKNINNLLYKIRNKVDSLDKKVQLSAAVKADPIISKKKWSQDWTHWINEGLIDFAVTMNYSPDIINFNHNIENIKQKIEEDKFDKIIMGISIYNQGPLGVSDKIYLSYLYNFKGISLFSYDNKKDSTYWFDDILDVFEIIE